MKEFDSAYDFYRLPEPERLALVGECFIEKIRGSETLYFPVQLTHDEGHYNYGARQGVLFVTPLLPRSKTSEETWFRVGVFSPDDLDLDLNFEPGGAELRLAVLEFIRTTGKQNVTYREILERIQDHVNAGEIDG